MAAVHLPLMVLELGTIVEDLVTIAVGMVMGLSSISVCRIVSHLLLVLLLLALKLLLRDKISASVLVQIKIERVLLVEIIVSLRNRMTVIFNLLDLV